MAHFKVPSQYFLKEIGKTIEILGQDSRSPYQNLKLNL
jgi:hypothetical protein